MNTLFELDATLYDALDDIRDGKGKSGLTIDSGFLELLRKSKVLVEKGEESQLLLARQYQRHAAFCDSSRLGLTICPTLQCNFRCPYCFEHSQAESSVMTPETVDRLMHFIKDQVHMAIHMDLAQILYNTHRPPLHPARHRLVLLLPL